MRYFHVELENKHDDELLSSIDCFCLHLLDIVNGPSLNILNAFVMLFQSVVFISQRFISLTFLAFSRRSCSRKIRHVLHACAEVLETKRIQRKWRRKIIFPNDPELSDTNSPYWPTLAAVPTQKWHHRYLWMLRTSYKLFGYIYCEGNVIQLLLMLFLMTNSAVVRTQGKLLKVLVRGILYSRKLIVSSRKLIIRLHGGLHRESLNNLFFYYDLIVNSP